MLPAGLAPLYLPRGLVLALLTQKPQTEATGVRDQTCRPLPVPNVVTRIADSFRSSCLLPPPARPRLILSDPFNGCYFFILESTDAEAPFHFPPQHYLRTPNTVTCLPEPPRPLYDAYTCAPLEPRNLVRHICALQDVRCYPYADLVTKKQPTHPLTSVRHRLRSSPLGS